MYTTIRRSHEWDGIIIFFPIYVCTTAYFLCLILPNKHTYTHTCIYLYTSVHTRSMFTYYRLPIHAVEFYPKILSVYNYYTTAYTAETAFSIKICTLSLNTTNEYVYTYGYGVDLRDNTPSPQIFMIYYVCTTY